MDSLSAFAFSASPRIVFGAGVRRELPALAAARGRRVLLVTGGASLEAGGRKAELEAGLRANGLEVRSLSVSGEPTVEGVDRAVAEHKDAGLEVVLAVGGGSVIDAGKAIAAMLPLGEPVEPYLEVARAKTHPGVRLPFLAAPTTSGAGAEATKNAPLRRLGPDGYKSSLRHDAFAPDVAVIDPELALNCPRPVTAACGLDALAQLLESYVSPQASPLTDALAWSGLERVRDCLLPACGTGARSLEIRAGMAYAALASGLALANAGLGVVHSLAGVLGGRFEIPHGVLCGTLLAAGTRQNLEKLFRTQGPGAAAVKKHAQVGELFARRRTHDPVEACGWLVEILEGWTRALEMPALGKLGVTPAAADDAAAKTPNRNNPVELTPEEIRQVLRARL